MSAVSVYFQSRAWKRLATDPDIRETQTNTRSRRMAGEKMFRRTSYDKLTKKIKPLLIQMRTEQENVLKQVGATPRDTSEDAFVRSVIDPRLTAEESAVLVQRLLEVREAFVAALLANRATSHSRDFVAG